MKMIKTKIISLLIGSAVAFAAIALNAAENTVSKDELKRDLEKFAEYLQSSTNQLNIASRRFDENRSCEAVGDAVIAALAYKDMSVLKQDGFHERLAKNNAVFGRSFMKKHNEKFQLIIDQTGRTEEQIDSFIQRFTRIYPDWVNVFDVYKRAVVKIKGYPNAENGLRKLIEYVHGAIGGGGNAKDVEGAIKKGAESAGVEVVILNPSEGLSAAAKNFLANPADPSARKAFIDFYTAKGMTPKDATALADAIAKRDWVAVAEILKKYPNLAPPIWQELMDAGLLGKNARPWAGYGPNGPSATDIQDVINGGKSIVRPNNALKDRSNKEDLVSGESNHDSNVPSETESQDVTNGGKSIDRPSDTSKDRSNKEDLVSGDSKHGSNSPSATNVPSATENQDVTNGVNSIDHPSDALKDVSNEEVLISDESDQWINGGARTKPRITGYYPQGKANGRLSRETEAWKEKSASGQITQAQKSYQWNLELVSDEAQGNKETFHMENTGQNKERGFIIEGWEVFRNGVSVGTGTCDKFTATYSDAGAYEIVASGKTKDHSIPFKVRESRDYKP